MLKNFRTPKKNATKHR
jgi:hypothetical protein